MAAIVLGGGAGLTWMFGSQSADRVSQEERDLRERSFAQLDHLALRAVSKAEAASSLEQMQLPAPDKEALAAALETDQPMRLVQLSVWDTHAQDGDVVAISGAGYRREVLITKTAQLVTVPVDASGTVRVEGVRDGGGGITLGIAGANREVLMPIMTAGQSFTLPPG